MRVTTSWAAPTRSISTRSEISLTKDRDVGAEAAAGPVLARYAGEGGAGSPGVANTISVIALTLRLP